MKQQLLKFGTESLAEASPLDLVWGTGLREDDPEAQDPCWWSGKHLLGKPLPAVRDTLRSIGAGLEHPAPSRQLLHSDHD